MGQPDKQRQARADRWQHRYRAASLTRVGQMLRDDREALGLTQREVAAELGFDQAKLSAYERGAVREPPTDRLIALARHYGFPPNRYVDELAWSRGVRIALGEPAPGTLVIAAPRAGLADLLEAGNSLSPTVFGELLQTAFDLAQAERAARRDPD